MFEEHKAKKAQGNKSAVAKNFGKGNQHKQPKNQPAPKQGSGKKKFENSRLQGTHSNQAGKHQPSVKSTTTKSLSSLQEQFKKKLEGARFRAINEELYTSPGHLAFEDFQQNPEKFDVYHKGYREQAAVWPVNPLDGIITWIRRHHRTAVIADMGCGDARLSETLSPLGYTVHSFDLVSVNERVVACNIAHTPLPAASVDVVVFCLSLMGVNFHEFIQEAHRVLKPRGVVKIVEVRSRFEGNNVQHRFQDYLQKCGFEVVTADSMHDNKMFFDVECVKVGSCPAVQPSFSLKACQYKKR